MSSGFSFGKPSLTSPFNKAPQLPPAPATCSGLAFGTAATKLTFGTATSAPVPSLNFSIPTLAAPAATGLSFGTTPGSLNFGATPLTSSNLITSSAQPAFGAAIASTPATTTMMPTTTTSTSFGLIGSTTATSTGLSFDLGGTSLPKLPATTVTSFNVLSQPATTVSSAVPRSVVGLGGISATPPKQPSTTTGGTTEQSEILPRDQVLPNELLQTVENFKKFVQEQKSCSSEIARFSVKQLKKVESDIDLVNNCINEMENELQKNRTAAETLQLDTAKGLQHAEMAQRTFDTPSGLQYDNTAPLSYFLDLSVNLEKEMNNLRIRIENIDKRVRNTGPLTALTPQDLSLGMRRLHETFVALAGCLQSVHNQVEFQKEQYLNLRKHILNDYSNVFEARSKELEALETALDSLAQQQPTIFTGPTPFGSLGNSQAQAIAQNPPPSYPGTAPIAASTQGFNIAGSSNASLFGSSMANSLSPFNTPSSSFQLQKPPIGNKRGKP